MGIDIYLSWPKMTKKQKKAQCTGFSIFSGDVGYLREAYHGGPYPSKILVREAFESNDCKARIPASVMRQRLTDVTEPMYGANGGHEVAMIMQKVFEAIKNGAKDGDMLTIEPGEIRNGATTPMSVEEAVRERCRLIYSDMPAIEVERLVDSYRAFVDLAEKMEKKRGKPCLVFASY